MITQLKVALQSFKESGGRGEGRLGPTFGWRFSDGLWWAPQGDLSIMGYGKLL